MEIENENIRQINYSASYSSGRFIDKEKTGRFIATSIFSMW